MSSNPNKLDQLKQKLQSKGDDGNTVTSLYCLIKELHCLPDILGREYEVVYEGNRIKKIIQKPISIPALMVLFKEMEKDYQKQEKEMKKSQRKGRRR